ncbi:cytochrome P450 [Mycena galericulata]|nr:cytochrome P450 [Mycena galericulata]
MPQDDKTLAFLIAVGIAALVATLGVPILGNAFDIPQFQPWVTFSQWAQEYGPIVHLRVFGKSLIVLNDVNDVTELLDRKSRIYSNRPVLQMGGELVGWAEGPAFIQFSKTWADYRRLMAQFLSRRSEIEFAYSHILEKATLRFVPQWVPGASWKRKVVPYRKTLQAMVDTPYDWVKKQMATGTSMSCVVSDLLDSNNGFEEERLVKWTAAGIYSAELEAALGQCTAPRLADRARLPYTEALISEILRTYTIGPIGLPHVAAEDDVHNGFFIPKDSAIITNNWLFYRDRKTYPEPEIFGPERFIETASHRKEKAPRDVGFGYGRRVCPGVHLADTTLWLLFASLLTFFDISAPLNDGRPVLPSGKFLDGSISHPEPSACQITPRKGAEEVIRRLSEA